MGGVYKRTGWFLKYALWEPYPVIFQLIAYEQRIRYPLLISKEASSTHQNAALKPLIQYSLCVRPKSHVNEQHDENGCCDGDFFVCSTSKVTWGKKNEVAYLAGSIE